MSNVNIFMNVMFRSLGKM